MVKKGNKAGGVKLMLQIFAVMIAAYVLFKAGVSFIKENLMARQTQEELNDVTQALGFETYAAGSVFESGNFRMPIEVNLYALDSLLNDSLVFAAIAQGRPGDRAGIMVTKQLMDKGKTLSENWQYFQQQSSGVSEPLEIDGDIDERDDHTEAVFEVKSSRRAGRVRLITKYDSVYVISVGSVREVWPAYEESLSKSLEHFTILY